MEAPLASLRVLSVGDDRGPLDDATVERVDDLLGALARLSDGGIDLVLLWLDPAGPEDPDSIRAIRERAPDVPVIAVAADELAEQALEAGAAEVVPPDGGQLLLTRAARYAVALGRMRSELHRREIVDEVTGLYNARGLEEFAAHHMALAGRSSTPLVVLSVRIDGPHEPGAAGRNPDRDRSLADTAEVVRAAVRDCDVVARRADGSFCVLLTGDAVGAEALVLSRLVDAVAVSNARAGRTGDLSLSVGAATYDPAHPVALEDLLAAADRQGERSEEPG
jgi:diguanylate cyclase (GGDEF)-like protein